MKSLLTLPEAYIRPEWRTCSVPGRPWWAAPNGAAISCRVVGDFKSLDYDVFLKRRDDLVLTKEFLSNPDDALSYLATRPESCDTTHPLPHPGYRAGQVWAWRRLSPEADGHLIEALPGWRFRVLHTDSEVNAVETGHSPLFGSLWRVDRPDAKNKVCATFLLHDPLRPDLAPWSSR